MRKVISAAAVSVALAGAAFGAEQQAAPQPRAQPPAMQQPKPSEEVRSLAVIFDGSHAWTSTVPAGAMGPGSKEMTAKARADCQTVSGGFGYSCLIRMVLGEGPEAMRYDGQLVVGYNAEQKAFHGFSVFSDGSAMAMNGKLEGKTFTLESASDVMEMGKPTRERISFDFTDPNNVKFTEAHKVAGGNWEVLSQSTMKPVSTGHARRAPGTR